MANDNPVNLDSNETDSMDQQGAPAAKKVKLAQINSKNLDESMENNEKLNQALDEIRVLEDKLEDIEEEQSNKIIELEQQYVKIKTPVYDERAKLIAKIPNFWATCIIQHGQLSSMLNEDDIDCFTKYLEDVHVDHELKDVKFTHKEDGKEYIKSLNCAITFTWKDNNPYFSNKTLTKSYFQLMETIVSECDKIDWHENMNLIEKGMKQAKNNDDENDDLQNESFFNWFEDQQTDEELGCDGVAEIFKEEIWPNALNCYLGEFGDDGDSEMSEDITAEDDE